MWSSVHDLAVVKLQQLRDKRGLLVPIELPKVVPFPVKRLFWISDVPVDGVRGAHAHKACHQFMICVAGRLTVEAFDGKAEQRFDLIGGQALHVPPAIFSTERFIEQGSILLVLCDQKYEHDDYLMERNALVEFRRQFSD